MKHFLILTLIALAQISFSQVVDNVKDSTSQEQESKNPIYIGLEGAFFHRDFVPSSVGNLSVSQSFGVKLEKQISRISLKSGLSYARKGAALTVPVANAGGGLTDFHSTMNTYYLILPLDFSLRFGKKRNFSIEGGAYGGYLLKFWSVVEEKDLNYYEASDLTNNDSFVTRLSFGVHFAMNYDIILSPKYKLGLTLFNDRDLTGVYSNPSPQRNNIVGVKCIVSRKM